MGLADLASSADHVAFLGDHRDGSIYLQHGGVDGREVLDPMLQRRLSQVIEVDS